MLLRFAGFYSNHLLVYCKVFCIWSHVNRIVHPVFNQKQRLSESRRYLFCFCLCSFFSEETKSFLFLALLVSIDHNHSISRHRPRKPSQKFNMCDFVATSQAFVAKAVIAWDHWCPYIVRHRALLCVLLTHVWKPGFTTSTALVIYLPMHWGRGDHVALAWQTIYLLDANIKPGLHL